VKVRAASEGGAGLAGSVQGREPAAQGGQVDLGQPHDPGAGGPSQQRGDIARVGAHGVRRQAALGP